MSINSLSSFNHVLRPDLPQVGFKSKNDKADALKELIKVQKSVFCFVGKDEKLEIIVDYKNRVDEDDIDLFMDANGSVWQANQLEPIVE